MSMVMVMVMVVVVMVVLVVVVVVSRPMRPTHDTNCVCLVSHTSRLRV